jgi:hypothetical protein
MFHYFHTDNKCSSFNTALKCGKIEGLCFNVNFIFNVWGQNEGQWFDSEKCDMMCT